MTFPSPKEESPVEEAMRLLSASSHALRSYQYGNGSGDLAKSTADAIDAFRVRVLSEAKLRSLKDAKP